MLLNEPKLNKSHSTNEADSNVIKKLPLQFNRDLTLNVKLALKYTNISLTNFRHY